MTEAPAITSLSASKTTARLRAQETKASEWEGLANCEECDYTLQSVRHYS